MDIVVKQCVKVPFGHIYSIWVYAKWVPKLWILGEKSKNFDQISKPNQSEPNQSEPNQSNWNFLKSPRAPIFSVDRPWGYFTCSCHKVLHPLGSRQKLQEWWGRLGVVVGLSCFRVLVWVCPSILPWIASPLFVTLWSWETSVLLCPPGKKTRDAPFPLGLRTKRRDLSFMHLSSQFFRWHRKER